MSDSTSTARVGTERPGRYGKQLVSHLGRHHGGEWDDEKGTGWISFDGPRADVVAEADTLVMTVHAPADDLERYEDVVARHLVRFGEKDELTVEWSRG